MPLANYYNRRLLPGFIAKGFAKLNHHARQFVESGEANEAQDIVYERLATVGDAAFGPISLREGGTVIINQAAGTVRIGASRVWAGGYMHQVADRTLTGVPMTGVVVIGLAVTETIVDGDSDPQLKGIVGNTASHGENLASRSRYDAVWARDGDPFYPVFTIIDGQIPNEIAPPASDSAELLVERHIEETHGSHIAEGFFVSSGGFTPGTEPGTGEQTFIISRGVLRAQGRRVARSVDQRYRRAENPQLVTVNGESHAYPAGGVVALNNGPIESIQTAIVVKEVVKTVTHQLANGTDALPDTPVFAIMAVNVGGAWNAGTRTFTGGTNYAENTSWVKSGDGISWAPGGAEPAPGTSVTIVYRYSATVTPQAVGRNTVTLEAAVVGQPVILNYRYKLRRIDVLAIDLNGSVVYLEGISSKFSPVPPPVPAPLAPLVRIDNQWGIAPIITDVDQRKLTEAEVRAMLRTVLLVYDQLSVVALEKDSQERDPASRKGSFVDPFINDSQRDLGISQDAAIVGGILQLPIAGSAETITIATTPIMLPYVTEAAISQPFRTLSQIINRYLNFAPLPTPVTLQPAIDRWHDRQVTSESITTSSFVQVSSFRPDLLGTPLYGTTSFSSSTSQSSVLVDSKTQDLPFLRQITVGFTVKLMGAGEQLDKVIFDGIDVSSSVLGSKTANTEGTMVGTFVIPPNIRAGTKSVLITGKGGSGGETSFTGQGTLTIELYHNTVSTVTVATTIDPVAQSFVLDQTRQMTGVRVEFTGRGDVTNPVAIELRTMEGNDPSSTTRAEGMVAGNFTVSDPAVVKPENWTEINFDIPTTVREGEWHAIALLTDDPSHAVAIAQLGDQSDPNAPRGFDARKQEWVRANPALGDLFDGSNAKSWRVRPDTDLTHEIMVARYTATTETVSLGTFDLSTKHVGGVSDIIVLLLVEEASQDTRVRLNLVRASGEVISFEPNIALKLDQYLTETVRIDMVLTGTATLSPIVMPDIQIVWGRLKPTALYVSQANEVDQTTTVKLRTVVEVNTPGSSSVALAVGGPGTWDDQTGPASSSLGDGWIERAYLEQPYGAAEARTKIVLTGTPKDRPLVRNLRQRATEI